MKVQQIRPRHDETGYFWKQYQLIKLIRDRPSNKDTHAILHTDIRENETN